MGRCKSKRRLDGKIAIVTGANSGIGLETCRDLAGRGAQVIMTARNEEKGKEAVDSVVSTTYNESTSLEILDLSSFMSIKNFVARINQKFEKIDLLINNAGLILYEKTITEDGIEGQLQTNHLGPFMLTLLLLPKLKASGDARIVMVSSDGHTLIKDLDFDNLQAETSYWALFQYGKTKLCNILFARELAKRLKNEKIIVNSLHPGVIKTNFGRQGVGFLSWMASMTFAVLGPFLKNCEDGAQTTIHVAVSEEVDGVSGEYFSDCKIKQTSSLGRDMNLAARLWEKSLELTKLTDPTLDY